MTSLDAGGLAAAPGFMRAQAGQVRFLGRDGPYWRLLTRGALLLVATLGIYRFWLFTDIRRFLWANTEISGDSLEYSGTALEILRGFLIAVALLVPLYIVFFLSAIDIGTAVPMSGVAIMTIALIGQFAVWQARKYRLSRTVFRGLRFHQSGSGVPYAVRALIWWTATALTLGLAYPFAQASLERLKLRHTHYGNLNGRFDGSGLALFLRGLPLWFMVMAPTLIALTTLLAVDWTRVGRIIERSSSTGEAMNRIAVEMPEFYGMIGLLVLALLFALCAALVLLPAFQTLVTRWWISGIRFAGISASSQLRMLDVYKAYLRFIGWFAMLALAMLVVAFIALALIGLVFGTAQQSKFAEAFTILTMVGIYVASALGLSTIYQVTIKLSLWRLTVQSTTLSGVLLLDHVAAAGQEASPVGEGLADALNVGGL